MTRHKVKKEPKPWKEMKTRAPGRLWGGMRFHCWHVGVLKYEHRNEDDTIRIARNHNANTFNCRFRFTTAEPWFWITSPANGTVKRFHSQANAALEAIALLEGRDSGPVMKVGDEPEEEPPAPMKPLVSVGPFAVADHLATMIGTHIGYPVRQLETTTGSAMLQIEVGGVKFNLTITKARKNV